MKRIYLLILLFTQIHFGQGAANFLEKNRNNEAALTAFFAQMPKGGDLHHHYSGSVYAEPLIEYAIKNHYFLNENDFSVAQKPTSKGKWISFNQMIAENTIEAYKIKIMQKWSAKDYNGVDYPSDKTFFDSFDKFWPLVEATFENGLLEIKNRAKAENVSYIETQLSTIPNHLETSDLAKNNAFLRKWSKSNEQQLERTLDSLYNIFIKRGAEKTAIDFNKNFVEKLHKKLAIDDADFTMRYQNFVLRFMEPVDLFKEMVLSFISASKSDLIVGVNIVSPEYGDNSMKDYKLHMLMYRFLNKKFPQVKYAMHAGELTMGTVLPEELTWHINDAVFTAKANRIGHGVDLAYEKKPFELLQFMAKNKIAIEINLVSNEFILKVKNDKHPLSLYHKNGVPVVISTDDAGILRTNHTEQFVLLAMRYPEISYSEIKQFVYNSIEYSFIKEPKVKDKLKNDLDKKFSDFEKMF